MPKNLQEAAQEALKQGRERDAFNLLYAHTLAELKADDASGVNVRWIAGLSRPSAALRWGVGVQYTPEKGFEGAPPQLGKEPEGGGENANNPGAPGNPGGREGRDNRRRPGNGGAPRGPGGPGGPGGAMPMGPGGPGGPGGGSGGGPPSDPVGALQYYTGELGDKILERLKKNTARGLHGEFLKSAPVAALGAGNGANGGVGGIPGMPMGPGGPGMLGAPGMPGAPGGPGGPAGAGGGESKDAGKGSLTPSVTMLGKGTPKDLLDLARDEGVDLLLVFEVSASQTRTGKISGDTKVRLVDPVGGKDLFAAKKLNNIQVYDLRQKPQGKADPIDEVVDLLFKHVDEKNYKLGDFPPELTADHVNNRVQKLLAIDHDNPLPVLVELRHYYRLKLLPGKQMFEGYKKLLGDELADQLAKGKLDEKREALADFLPDGHKLADPNAPQGSGAVTGGGGVGGYSPPGPGSGPPGTVPGSAPPMPGFPGGTPPMPGFPGGAPPMPGFPGGAPPMPGAPGVAPPLPGIPGGAPGVPGVGAAAGGAQKLAIPGTQFAIPVPTGFTLGSDAGAPVMTNGTASISAKREDKSLKTALADYSADNLARGGFTLSDKKEIDALGSKVAVIQAVHNESKFKFLFALMPDSENSVVIVSARYSAEDEIRLGPAVMSAMMSMSPSK